MIARLKQIAGKSKLEVYALYLALRDRRVPWYTRVFAALVVGYAFSPIDLIPDFIPVLGYLDDLLLIPLGVAIVVKMVPPAVMAECRLKSAEVMSQGRPVNKTAAAIVILVWVTAAALVIFWVYRLVKG